jgi:hypothetical protein
MVLHVSGITASPVSRHKATRSQEAKGRSRASASEGSIGNLMVSLKKAAKHNSHRRCDVANRQPPCARSRAPSKQGKSKKNIEVRVSFGIGSIGKRPPITVAPRAD